MAPDEQQLPEALTQDASSDDQSMKEEAEEAPSDEQCEDESEDEAVEALQTYDDRVVTEVRESLRDFEEKLQQAEKVREFGTAPEGRKIDAAEDAFMRFLDGLSEKIHDQIAEMQGAMDSYLGRVEGWAGEDDPYKGFR